MGDPFAEGGTCVANPKREQMIAANWWRAIERHCILKIPDTTTTTSRPPDTTTTTSVTTTTRTTTSEGQILITRTTTSLRNDEESQAWRCHGIFVQFCWLFTVGVICSMNDLIK